MISAIRRAATQPITIPAIAPLERSWLELSWVEAVVEVDVLWAPVFVAVCLVVAVKGWLIRISKKSSSL